MTGVTGSNAVRTTESHSSPLNKLKVLLDARKLGGGGIGVYIENLIAGLAAHGGSELTLIVKPGAVQSFPFIAPFARIEDSTGLYSLAELFTFSRKIDFSRYDIFHVPHFTLPFGIKIPAVITVHDLIHVNHPEKFFYPWISRPLIGSSLKRAARVVTVSRSSFDEISGLVREDAGITGKVRVVPNTVDPLFLEGGDTENSNTARRAENGAPYLLAVASNIKPHKGIRDLLTAFARARKEAASVCPDLKLMLVGQGIEAIKEGHELFGLAGKDSGVILGGRVDKAGLLRLYRGASAVVVASKAEGFCLPVLEAQAAGVPVIARPVPAVCELLTPYDFKAADFSVEALGSAITGFVKGRMQQESDAGREARREHLRKFSREDAARAVFQVYQEALGAGGPV